MTQLTTVNNEFTVNKETGEAYVSQREAARQLGIGQSTLSEFCRSRNLVANQGVTSNIMDEAITYYAFDARSPTSEARNLAKAVMKAGTKAWMYHQAGYQFDAAPKQLTPAEALLASAQQLVDHEKRLGQIEHEQGKTKQLVEDHLVKAEYFTIGMFAKEKGLQLSRGEAISMGSRASKQSQQAGYTVETFRDWQNRPRKHYHEDVLNEIFQG